MAGKSSTRYRYRVRVSTTTLDALQAEWDRCRWVWNECVAQSRAAQPPGRSPSKGYRAAKRRAAKTHASIARRRQDDARKWAKRVVREFDRLAVEDFRPKFLAKSRMARKAADAAIAAVKRELADMARKHCRELELVHPAHTTTDCAQCGARTKHALPLSERVYHCTHCGHTKLSGLVVPVDATAGDESGRPGRPPVVRAAQAGNRLR